MERHHKFLLFAIPTPFEDAYPRLCDGFRTLSKFFQFSSLEFDSIAVAGSAIFSSVKVIASILTPF